MERRDWKALHPAPALHARADRHLAAERRRKRLTGWFRVLELRLARAAGLAGEHPVLAAAERIAAVREGLARTPCVRELALAYRAAATTTRCSRCWRGWARTSSAASTSIRPPGVRRAGSCGSSSGATGRR